MDTANDEFMLAKQGLAKDMVGEIVLSSSPEKAIKKWRSIFQVSQKDLANKLGITASVVSDYESGRRKSPGIRVIKKYIESLLMIDSERGGNVIKSFVKSTRPPVLSSAIADIKEFSNGINMNEFCRLINANMVSKGRHEVHETVYGYTIIDSIKAITELSYADLIKLYGITTQRALIFTKVSTGRTPLVAIKVTNIHPALVVLHGVTQVDDVARSIAEAENIPLAICMLEKSEDIGRMLEEVV